MDKHYISADEYLLDQWRLAEQVRAGGWRPDFLVGLWRGGAPPAIARQFSAIWRSSPARDGLDSCADDIGSALDADLLLFPEAACADCSASDLDADLLLFSESICADCCFICRAMFSAKSA